MHSPRRGAARGAMIAIFIVLAVVVTSTRRGRRASSERESAVSTDTSKFVPAGDEGLGASIALVLDVSGSMRETAESDSRPKYIVAREALEAMLQATDSFVTRQPDFPVNVGLYTFSNRVNRVVPVQKYDRQALISALDSLGEPSGGTAIGDAMDVARQDLYAAGTIRKYILVVTDGENTDGRSPEAVAREIARRSEGAVRQYFVAFDVDERHFAFLKDVNGEVLGASNGLALRASLDSIYRGKILAESMNAGETALPARRDSGGLPRTP